MVGKRYIFAVLASTLCTSAAMAADLPPVPAAVAPLAPAFSWSGFYLGVNIGYGGGQFSYPFAFTAIDGSGGFGGTASVTSGGVLGGGQVGYNWAFANNFLLGFETDFDGAAIRGKVQLDASGFSGPGALSVSAGSKIQTLGTVRGRAGYAFDRFLVYATGGFAYGQVSSEVNISAPDGGGLSISRTPMRTGWTVGGGFEYAITNNLTVKTEYLYVDLGNDAALFNGLILGQVNANVHQKTTANIVRAGLNYKFDWFAAPAAVVAKY
jgi:outer membrane immunogenic protein